MDLYADLNVRLIPGSKKDEICVWMADGSLKVKIRAKPVEGKANRYLIDYLSKKLNIRKNQVEIISGKTSRQKVLRFWGMKEEDLKHFLDQLLNQEP